MFFVLLGLSAILGIVIIGCINFKVRRVKNQNSTHPLNESIKNITINGSNIKYVEKGNGQPIIMIHGSQMNSYDWRSNIDFFAKKYKVYAIDMIGCGCSDKPRGAYSPDFFAEFIKVFMNHLNIDKAIFIASSWGGEHTLHFGLKYPERASALILSSPCGYKHKFNPMDILRVPLLGRLILLFTSKVMLKSQLVGAHFNKNDVGNDLVNAIYTPFFMTGFIQATLMSYKNANFKYVQENISHIAIPTLLIWGQHDKIHPLDMAEKMNNEIMESELIIYEKCGHLPHSEKPEQFNHHAEQFITKTLC